MQTKAIIPLLHEQIVHGQFLNEQIVHEQILHEQIAAIDSISELI